MIYLVAKPNLVIYASDVIASPSEFKLIYCILLKKKYFHMAQFKTQIKCLWEKRDDVGTMIPEIISTGNLICFFS